MNFLVLKFLTNLYIQVYNVILIMDCIILSENKLRASLVLFINFLLYKQWSFGLVVYFVIQIKNRIFATKLYF